MQVSPATKFPQTSQNNPTAFEGKGEFKPHNRFPPSTSTAPYMKKPVPKQYAPYNRQPYSKHPIPLSKPSVTPISKPAAQFPPTPSTIIKPPRFYSNQSLIIPRSKPNVSGVDSRSNEEKDCICERDDAIIICQKCGSELMGRVQSKCSAHPRKIPLMDHRECLNVECRSVKLVEITLDD